MWYKNIAGRFFGLVTKHACDGQTDKRTNGRTDRITTPKTALSIARAVINRSHRNPQRYRIAPSGRNTQQERFDDDANDDVGHCRRDGLLRQSRCTGLSASVADICEGASSSRPDGRAPAAAPRYCSPRTELPPLTSVAAMRQINASPTMETTIDDSEPTTTDLGVTEVSIGNNNNVYSKQ